MLSASDGDGDEKNKKVQIPLFIVIPPMGSSAARLVWSAEIYSSWNNLSQNSDHDDYTVYMKVALTMEIIATNSIKLTMKQFDYFAWEYFEYRIWVVGVAP